MQSDYSSLTANDLKELVLQGDKNALESLVKRASTKERTGFLNEHDWPIEVRKEENRVQRGQSVGGIVINIDLAGFKRLNDTYGMEEGGNSALKEFSIFLRSSNFREIDIIANPGGDEFFVILTNTKLEIPDFNKLGKNPLTKEFKNACTDNQRLWFRLENFAQKARAIPFSSIDKSGTPFMDLIRTRITFASYGHPDNGDMSLSQALNHSEKQAELQKKLTKTYVLGGR